MHAILKVESPFNFRGGQRMNFLTDVFFVPVAILLTSVATIIVVVVIGLTSLFLKKKWKSSPINFN